MFVFVVQRWPFLLVPTYRLTLMPASYFTFELSLIQFVSMMIKLRCIEINSIFWPNPIDRRGPNIMDYRTRARERMIKLKVYN